MPTSNNNTAILVFIRSEKEEAQIKKFGSCLSFKGHYRIASLLNDRVKAIAKKSGLPTIVVAGNQQKGENFGQRITQAVSQVFEKGFDNVIAIGNDCLTISPNLLKKAAAELATKKIVLGPTLDGGVYLIGFQKAAFFKATFSDLPWQSNQLFDSLVHYFQASAAPDFHIFETAIDADDSHSFELALNYLSNHFSIKNVLQNLLQNKLTQQVSHIVLLPLFFLKGNVNRRGPPTIFSTF